MNTFNYKGKEIPFSKQYFNWHISTYAKEEEFQELLNYVPHYAYILHDKDECEPHFHILLSGVNISANAIKSRIHSEQNTRFSLMENRYNDFIYLTHDNIEDKFHYNKSEVVCDNLAFWQLQTAETKEEKNEEFLNDLLTLSKFQLAVKYGRDFMKNWRNYLEFAQIVSEEEIQKNL